MQKRFLLSLLLVFVLLSSALSQEQQSITAPSTESLFNDMNNYLNSLDNEMLNMKMLSIEQEQQIESLENALKAANVLLTDSEMRCTSLENDIQKWKTCSIVLGATTVTLTVAIITVPLLLKFIKWNCSNINIKEIEYGDRSIYTRCKDWYRTT